ncbi:hypothetical protein B0T26DRAFT_744715 [Lasiosphaeria miniovina]|uniref:ADF-H domain-containing protein n=2 Tax=Lasiosphaeria TaxID=92901 RepID=A0AA40DG04_9PEZI|nr:uncharacterized protein B0T26DRAFT_744715 [Lasiosphaeria miniovina]KAK0701660.1 hypothetical protein B0T26DRAFT_744715 [Lasiosphaeria miniovina]KAK3358608.1 hypothetical protein B0T24DRAFT_643978 [Lasiosphaeria ovina]
MASEARLYTITDDTKEKLRKFRLGTSRINEPQAVIYLIDKQTKEIRQDEDEVLYKTLEDIADDLPENSPRFVLLSYPMITSDGRQKVPYVMFFYMPQNCNAAQRMLYAGAKELMRNTSEVTKIVDLESAEDLEEVPTLLAD